MTMRQVFQPVHSASPFGIVLLTLLLLTGGCATQSAPPIGQWFGPTVPAPISFHALPNTDASARLVKTPHYDIYTTIGDDDLLNQLAQLMEGSLQAYETLAPDTVPSKTPMQCYIFKSRMQWAEFTREHTGPRAPLYLQINRGAYTIGDWFVAYYIGEGSTISVSAHEGWHQFVARRFKARPPAFMEEGWATMFEGVQFKNGLPIYNLSINQNRAIALRDAIDTHSLWPLGQLVGMNAGDVVGRPGNKIEAFYAQAWAMGRFLWDGANGANRPILRQILADMADGTVYDPTGPPHTRLSAWSATGVKLMLEHYLHEPFDQINADYTAFCRHIAYDELPGLSETP